MIPLSWYLALSAALFCIGLFGVFTRRNAIAILMSIELMLNAVNINFVAFSAYLKPHGMLGQVFAIFVITVAAAEAAVGLAIIINLYVHAKHIEADKINIMKW
jgi:NAD(P)H-quinone oxidoreductase subunit 4L